MRVEMKPEIRTPGGETVALFSDDQWIGDIYLIYREGEVLRGTVQVDTASVAEHELDQVFQQVKNYIVHLTSALDISDSSVVCIYGDIGETLEMEAMDIIEDEEVQTEPPIHPEITEVHESPAIPRFGSGQVYATAAADNTDYYLTLSEDSIGSDRQVHTDYVLHDDFDNQIGLVAVDHVGESITGRVEFWVEPDKGETNEVARLLTKQFSDDAGKISFTMNWQDQHLGDIHLEHPDMI